MSAAHFPREGEIAHKDRRRHREKYSRPYVQRCKAALRGLPHRPSRAERKILRHSQSDSRREKPSGVPPPLHYAHVRALAAELGAEFTLDPTITPKMDGDRSILDLNVREAALQKVFRDESLIGNVEEFCAPPAKADEEALEALPCSAGHTACYISPYGDVYPCVQFPLPSGNVRRSCFLDIWRYSGALKELRSIRLRDLPTCSACTHVMGCTRCPGLAYMEGNMRGPSLQDCEKSFARTGIPSTNLLSQAASTHGLVQIQAVSSCSTVD